MERLSNNNLPLGQVATIWIEVFVCPGELAAAETRARAAQLHTIVADKIRSRVVLMVRTPIRRDEQNPETKAELLAQVERTIRGTLAAAPIPQAWGDPNFKGRHQKPSALARTRPDTDARDFELAVLSLGRQVTQSELDLLQLYLVLSGVQDRKRFTGVRGGSWSHRLVMDGWHRGDVGFERHILDQFDPPAPPTQVSYRDARTTFIS